MRKSIKSISLLLSCFLFAVNAFSQARLLQSVVKKGNEVVIPFQKYVLPNGLTVILTEDHSDPIAHIDVSYHVGSAREELGKSGFAHFFEHMMFAGSEHVPNGDHFKIITAAGGSLNGSTNLDRTSYYETVPNNQLEKVLWLESDRMGFLLDSVTQQKFEIQRSTVKNERGQNFENQPYGLAGEAIFKALYPYGHPYSWPTIGYVEDLNKVDVDDLKRFFLRWYGPNNATLTIGGDIDIKQTLAWVEKYFGSIPTGPEVKPTILPSPSMVSDRYISYIDNYAVSPMLSITYPGVKVYDNDEIALEALSVMIGQNSNSIFYKNLIKNGKAISASMATSNEELAGNINIVVTPYSGQSLADIKKLVNESFKEFEQTGLSDDDLLRFKSSYEARFISGLASVSGKVKELSFAQILTGDPNQIGQKLESIRKIKKADVMRVYHTYIKGKGAVILSVLPKGGTVKPAAPDNYFVDKRGYKAPDYEYKNLTYQKAKDSFDRTLQPPVGANPVVKVPTYWTATKANGIKIIGSVNNEIPNVSLVLSVKGGGLLASEDSSKAGLPSIVAQMLNDKTEKHTAEQMSSSLDKLGSFISVSASAEETEILASSLTKNFDETLALLKERIFYPKFTQETLDRIKIQMIQNLQNAKKEVNAVTREVYKKILYGNDNIRNYGLSGNQQTIQKITLKDVQNYYDNFFVPSLVTIVVVGDISEADVNKKLSFLNNWKGKKVDIPAGNTNTRVIEKNTLYLVDIPQAAQSEIRIGYTTKIKYDVTGLYYKLGLVNFMLGGDFNSRLNLDLREKKGWTYDAGSLFNSDRYGGDFTAYSSVNTLSTDSAVAQIIKDISEFSEVGITPTELEFTKSSIGQGDALKYETNLAKASFLSLIQKYNLKPTFVFEQNKILENITKAEFDELAKRYLDTSQMAILVVGDKEKVMHGLVKLGYRIIEIDTEGKLKYPLK